MNIKNANLSHSVQHQLQSLHTRSSVEMSRHQLDSNTNSTRVSITDIEEPSGKHQLLGVGINNITPAETISVTAEEFHSAIDYRLRLMRDMILSMTGKQIPSLERKIEKTNELSVTSMQALSLNNSLPFDPTIINPSNEAPANSFVRVDLNLFEEYERTEVNIGGELDFDDGTRLNFNLNIEMERHYKEEAIDVLRQERVLTDPLVLNFGGESARLSAQRTLFDLDSDGEMEEIASLASNSAYLALDRNQDGIINNGAELFGPQSGNGFKELAMYDDDGNGFIDASDRIYSQLSVFNPESNTQRSLKEVNVGALYLNAVDSPFRLTDSNNETLGQVRSTSFYLTNDRQVNSLQQIDLAV